MHDENYRALADAIVLKAVDDYRKTKTYQMKNSIKRFFRSNWFGILTNIDPETLITRLDMEVKSND